MHNPRSMAITSTILAGALCIQTAACSKDDLRRSFSKTGRLHHEYHFAPPKWTIHSLKVDFDGEIVEAVEGASILSVQFSSADYQQAVKKYMEDELRGAGLMNSTKPDGDLLICRFARVSAQYVSEGSIPYISFAGAAGEVDLDCFLDKSGWRHTFVGKGKSGVQDPESTRRSVNIAIDDATQKLIMTLFRTLGAISQDQ